MLSRRTVSLPAIAELLVIDRTLDHWRRRLECVVQQQGIHIEHLT